jgi:hypothetical protein
MSYLSDFLKTGAVLNAKAGSSAINAGDLLQYGPRGEAWPSTTVDYAVIANGGAAAVPATTVSAYGPVSSPSRGASYLSPIDGSIFVLAPHIAGAYGMTLYKYSASGTLLLSIITDSQSAATNYNPIVQKLSNGNILCTWLVTGGAIYYAIYDVNLIPIVTKTLITTPNTNFYSCCKLTGGGFFVSYPLAGGISYLILSNTGATVIGSTAIASVGTTGQSSQVIELSNLNVVVAITSFVTSKGLAYSIFDASGTSVVALTYLNTAASNSGYVPELSVMPGYFAASYSIGAGDLSAYVVSNAGVVQGSAYTNGGTIVTSQGMMRITNDNVSNFWLTYSDSVSIKQIYTKMPNTGTGYVKTISGLNGNNACDLAYDRGMLILNSAGIVYVNLILQSGNVSPISNFNSGVLNGDGIFIKTIGDFCVYQYGATTSGTKFSIYKYIDASILGVSLTTLAAGNEGTIIAMSEGPGGFPLNPLLGSTAKLFNHSAANVPANQGTLYQNSVALKGV